MSNTFKKIVSSFVSLTTIAWSVGVGTLAAPSVASAASVGDLIKASGPAVYYYAADQKRYVFPNEKTYYSWFTNFSTVKTISDAELAAILIGGNVTIRPGTKLVKITTDPKTYAVTEGGVLHWIESEALATALYGSAWNQRIVDVPDGFFVNYSVGSSVSTPVHPDGTLITYSGSPTRYVVWGGQKRMITDAAFVANNFNPAFVITTTIVYPNGSDVTGREGDLADVIHVAGAPVGGNLMVSLASDTPAGVTVPRNAASVQLAKFNFTAGSSDALITGLRVHRVGVGATSDFANVYLYDGSGTRLTSGRTVNSTTNNVEFNSLNITARAGQTISLVIVGDFSSPASTGGQHAFEISDAASTVISGSGTVSGSFPVRGNVFTVGTTLAARVDVQKGTQPTNPNIGQTDAEISNFKLVANTNDVEIRRVTLLQAGSITNSDLSDLKLYQGVTLVASAASLTNDKIVLTFNPPYVLTNGTTKTFSLHAKVAGRAGRTIRTYVEYTTDVYAIDKIYNSGAAVCIASTAIGGCTGAGQGSFDGTGSNFIEVTTQGGQLTVAFNGPSTQNVAKGQQDVVLYKFSLTSPDNTLEIRNIRFKLQGATANDLIKGSAGTEYFRDIKIKNLDTGATVMGPTSLPAALASSSTNAALVLADSFNLNAGQTLNLAITADPSNTEDLPGEFFGTGAHQYNIVLGDVANAIIFNATDVRIVSTGEFLDTTKIVPNSPITGNNVTIKASSLDISLAGSPSSNTVVKKQTNIQSVGLVLTAGAQSDLLVTAMKLTGMGNVDGAYHATSTAQVITSCALFDGSNQVGLSQTPDVTLGTMNITNMNLAISKGTSKTLIANCTADSTVAQALGDSYAIGIASTNDVTAQDQDSNTVIPTLSAGVVSNAGATPVVIQTVRNSGTLTIATDNLRQSTILVAGGDVWQNLAQFKATAQFENMNIDRINVSSTGDSANFTAIAVAKDGAVKGWDVLPAGVDRNKDIDLSANQITVPKDGSATFQIWGKLAGTQSSSSVSGATTGVARSGNTMALGIGANIQTGEWDVNYANKFNVRSTGAASGDRVYGAGVATVGNTFVMRKSKPTVTRQALSTNTLANGSDQDLYKVQISADSAGSVALKKMTFTLSKTGVTTLANFRMRRGSSDLALADYSITDENGVDLKAGTMPAATSSAMIVVTFTNEETISGSGNVYTLHATPAASVAGDTVSTAFTRDLLQTVTTGYLAPDTFGGLVGPNIDTAASPDSTSDVVGYFVWSDNSEVPHSSSVGAASSRDWTNDVYVEDLTQTLTLSR